MENSAFLFVNTSLIVGCTAMAFVFLILPLPKNNGLYKYRISLRFLAGAYLILASLQFLSMAFNISVINLLSIEVITVASLQAPLFTFTLITLINPQLTNTRFITIRLMPILILLFLYFLCYFTWGDPNILNLRELEAQALHPTVVVRELFIVYYAYQLVYLTRLFCKQIHIYEAEIDNYFGDNQSFHISWIRNLFYAAFSVGVCVFFSLFIYSTISVLIFTIVYTLFYLGFAFYYIQYPSTFIYIEKVISKMGDNSDDLARSHKRLIWEELKEQIITEKYYLRTGVTIEEMAQFLKIGRTTLSLFINNKENMSFNLWVNSLRMEEAKHLLKEYPDYSIAQIAEMTGHSELSNFSRQFKLITNESPSVWRQSCQS